MKYNDGRSEYADMCTHCLSLSDNTYYKIKDPTIITEDEVWMDD